MSTPKRKLLDSLDDFTKGYLECLYWSSSKEDPDNPDSDGNFEEHSFDEMAVDSLKRCASDCKAFQEDNAASLSEAYEKPGYTDAYAGHDFCLTRNGHGAGFWDRGLGAVGIALTKASEEYGDINLYLFRGKIWLQ